MRVVFSKEECDYLTSHIEYIKKIVSNKSCSALPIGLREKIIELYTKLGYKGCKTCSSALMQAVNLVYVQYLNDNNVYNSVVKTKVEDEKTKPTGSAKKATKKQK